MVRCAYCGNEGKYQLKNGKWCCFKSANTCPTNRQKNSNTKKDTNHYTLPKINANTIRVNCSHCNKEVSLPGLKTHVKYCYLNPSNVRFCPVCDSPIKNYRTSKTCGYSCSNTFHKRGVSKLHGRPFTSPRGICFNNHIKKCIICGEFRIVSVHHYDGNKDNNNPENLVPLCSTHHMYMHSRYRSIIEKEVKKYIQNFISNCQRGIKCTTMRPTQGQEFLKE